MDCESCCNRGGKNPPCCEGVVQCAPHCKGGPSGGTSHGRGGGCHHSVEGDCCSHKEGGDECRAAGSRCQAADDSCYGSCTERVSGNSCTEAHGSHCTNSCTEWPGCCAPEITCTSCTNNLPPVSCCRKTSSASAYVREQRGSRRYQPHPHPHPQHQHQHHHERQHEHHHHQQQLEEQQSESWRSPLLQLPNFSRASGALRGKNAYYWDGGWTQPPPTGVEATTSEAPRRQRSSSISSTITTYKRCCCKCKMGYCLEKFDRFLNRIFYRLGEVIARHTGYFIIIPIFLSAILATGFQRIRYEDNPEYLFAPTNGGGRDERLLIESHFSMNFSSNFDPSRITRTGRFARFIVLAHDNGTLLREDVWDEIMMLNELVHEVKITFDEQTYRYDDLCAITRGSCYENNVLDIHELIPEVLNGTFKLTYPTMFNPNTFELYLFPLFFGGVNVTENGILESARALSIMYWLNTNSEKDDIKAAEWEEAVLDRVANTKFNRLFVSRFTSRTLETELENNTNSVIPFFGVTVAIMLIFSVVTVMMADWVRSKPYIGLMGVISAVLAVAAAFGFLIYLDIEFIGINMAAPFLMLDQNFLS
ncbi:patched domain-containing protein 3-like [Oratosquilla oratoria]|uniref:patched domain-containing protein 3-like n=1 Tax=Oratosquilla oratoria TaxID=337810 RepID=UPI003F761B33